MNRLVSNLRRYLVTVLESEQTLCSKQCNYPELGMATSMSDTKQLHLEGLQREVDFLQNENQLLKGFLQRVSTSCYCTLQTLNLAS